MTVTLTLLARPVLKMLMKQIHLVTFPPPHTHDRQPLGMPPQSPLPLPAHNDHQPIMVSSGVNCIGYRISVSYIEIKRIGSILKVLHLKSSIFEKFCIESSVFEKFGI